MTRKKVLGIVAITTVLIATLLVGNSYGVLGIDKMMEAGQITKKYRENIKNKKKNKKTLKIIAKAGDIEITSDQIEGLQRTYDVFGNKKTKKELIDQLIANKLIKIEADKLNIEVTEDEVMKYISKTKEVFKTDKEAYSQFKSYTSGLGITENEYWERIKPICYSNFTVGKYKNEYLLPKFKKENKDLIGPNFNKEFEKYYRNFKDEIVKNAKVKYYMDK